MTQWRIGLLGGALVAVVVVAAVVWPRSPVGAAAVGVHHAAPPATGPIDASVAARARNDVGLSLVDASPADLTGLPATSEATAVATANASSANGTMTRLSLVRATKAGTDNPGAGSGLRHVNQLAWAAVFVNAREPLFGPVDGGPHTRRATLVLLIDPADGSLISAAYF